MFPPPYFNLGSRRILSIALSAPASATAKASSPIEYLLVVCELIIVTATALATITVAIATKTRRVTRAWPGKLDGWMVGLLMFHLLPIVVTKFLTSGSESGAVTLWIVNVTLTVFLPPALPIF